MLLSDLAEWPPAFRKGLRGLIEESTDDLKMARYLFERFERLREAGTTIPSSCACGCNGLNSALGGYLDGIREAAEELRASNARTRIRHQMRLKWAKRRLLGWMWETGQRSIDRLALGQHAVEAAKIECERCELEITRAGFAIEAAEKQLALRVYQRAPKKGQPLPKRLLCEAEKKVASGRATVQRCRARIVELHHLIAWDVPRLVRQYTGCVRRGQASA